MNLESLKYFLAIADGKTFMDVAEDYHISQSSCSKSIMHLEEELGVKLFDRSGRSVKLTVAGQQLQQDLSELRPGWLRLEQHIQALREGNHTSICIMPSLSSLGLPTILWNFSQQHPGLHLETSHSRDYSGIVQKLRDGELDFSVMHAPVHKPSFFNMTFLHEDHILALFPKNHPLSGEKEVSLTSLCEETFLVNEWGGKILEQVEARTGIMPKHVDTINTNRENILMQIHAGKRIGIYYASDLSFYSLHNIHAARLSDVPDIPWVIISNKERKLSDLQMELKRHIIRSMPSVVMPELP